MTDHDNHSQLIASGLGAGLGVQFGGAVAVLINSLMQRHYGIALNDSESTSLTTIVVTPFAMLSAYVGARIKRRR